MLFKNAKTKIKLWICYLSFYDALCIKSKYVENFRPSCIQTTYKCKHLLTRMINDNGPAKQRIEVIIPSEVKVYYQLPF